jgi:hypothetical protein
MNQQYQPIYYNSQSNSNSRLPLTPNSISPPSLVADSRTTATDCNSNPLTEVNNTNTNESPSSESSSSLSDYPQEITWLFFRDNKWVPFQSKNHYKIEQAFTLGGTVCVFT